MFRLHVHVGCDGDGRGCFVEGCNSRDFKMMMNSHIFLFDSFFFSPTVQTPCDIPPLPSVLPTLSPGSDTETGAVL